MGASSRGATIPRGPTVRGRRDYCRWVNKGRPDGSELADSEGCSGSGWTAERRAAIDMLNAHDPGSTRQITLGADKGYDAAEFVADLRTMCVTPHIAAKTKGSAVDARTTRHPGYAVSQQKRKRVEEIFGWLKTVALFRKLHHRGVRRVGWLFTFAAAVYNLVRLRTLIQVEAEA